MSDADHFVCPNGHRVDRIRTINCPEPGCRASVVYEPGGHGMALWLALQRAHAALDVEHGHTGKTWADRERWTAAKLDRLGGQ
jgi:hypothetical protein